MVSAMVTVSVLHSVSNAHHSECSLTSSWLMLRILCSGLGATCPLDISPGAGLASPGGGLLMPSFSDATEFRLPLALAAGVGEPGFAPLRAPLRVGIWLCGPSAERISRDTGGSWLVVCEEPFLLDLKRKDIIWCGRGLYKAPSGAAEAGRRSGYASAIIGCRAGGARRC